MSYGLGSLMGGQQVQMTVKASDLMNTPIAGRDKGEIEMMLDAGSDQLKRLQATIDRLESRLSPVLTQIPAQPSAPVAESTSCVLSLRLYEVNVGLMQASERLISILDRCHL